MRTVCFLRVSCFSLTYVTTSLFRLPLAHNDNVFVAKNQTITCSLGVSPARLLVAALAATNRPTRLRKAWLSHQGRPSPGGLRGAPPSFVFNLLLAGLYTGCFYLLPSGITATAFMQTPGAVNMISSMCICSVQAYTHSRLNTRTTHRKYRNSSEGKCYEGLVMG
jgi:hypothetical protein